MYDLRQGVAIRSLHRISFLSRLNTIFEEALDMTIRGTKNYLCRVETYLCVLKKINDFASSTDIGSEAMRKRGCPAEDYSTLDMDLKARFVTTDELMYALSTKMSVQLESYKQSCPPWWDRSCDLGLLIGTFFHGLGNYDAMRNDEDLPFSNKIKSYVMSSSSEAESFRHFEMAANSAKRIFDTALVTMKRKFQEQTHAAVAAVFAASKNAGENDAKTTYLAKTQELDDDDIVSLPRLKDATTKACRESFELSKAGQASLATYSLPLPDSKFLDYLLVKIVRNIECNSTVTNQADTVKQGKTHVMTGDPSGQKSEKCDILTNIKVLAKAKLPTLYNVREATGQTNLLFQRSHSGVDKKPQDDGSDYFLGAASQELATIAVGADSSRYQRGPYVPLIITRFALGAILHAEHDVIACLMNSQSKNATNNAIPGHELQKPLSSEAESVEDSEKSLITSTPHDEGEKKSDEMSPANHPIWKYIQDNTTLRASICTVMLQGGYSPSSPDANFVGISAELLLELQRNPDLLPPIRCLSSPSDADTCLFFNVKDALLTMFNNAGMDWPEDEEPLHVYIQSVLLPHCLKLCLTLAEEQTKIACDQGKTDVYLGRPSYSKLCPLPDPFIAFEYHSEEAMSHAYAILRRTRLMKSVRFIVGGGIPLKALTEFLRGSFWLGQAMGVPIW